MIFSSYPRQFMFSFRKKRLKQLGWGSLWLQISGSMIAIVLLQWLGFALWTKWVMMNGMVHISPFMLEPLLKQLIVAFIIAIPILIILIYVTTQRTLHPLSQLRSWSIHRQSRLPRYLPQELQDVANTCQQLSVSVATTQAWQHQFTTQVSHELRTPLSLVYGYLQSIGRRSENLTEAQREALQTALQETEQTLEILKRLLMFARSQSEMAPVLFQTLTLQPLLQEAIQFGQTLLPRQIRLHNHHPEGQIWGDRGLFLQMIVHLIHHMDQELLPEQAIAIVVEPTETHLILFIPHAVQVEGKGLHFLMVQSLVTALGAELQLYPTSQMDYDLKIQFPRLADSNP
ncbi:MAG: HAMP domain-containing sensor histidine kinase [Synechococcales bacterium]|nr:HAMP domain-containing sensor histidine kinase [Synechococcales bacterium]